MTLAHQKNVFRSSSVHGADDEFVLSVSPHIFTSSSEAAVSLVAQLGKERAARLTDVINVICETLDDVDKKRTVVVPVATGSENVCRSAAMAVDEGDEDLISSATQSTDSASRRSSGFGTPGRPMLGKEVRITLDNGTTVAIPKTIDGVQHPMLRGVACVDRSQQRSHKPFYVVARGPAAGVYRNYPVAWATSVGKRYGTIVGAATLDEALDKIAQDDNHPKPCSSDKSRMHQRISVLQSASGYSFRPSSCSMDNENGLDQTRRGKRDRRSKS